MTLVRMTPVVQKKAKCKWCGKNIPQGTHAVYRQYEEDGETVVEYLHLPCEDAMLALEKKEGTFEYTPYMNKAPECKAKFP